MLDTEQLSVFSRCIKDHFSNMDLGRRAQRSEAVRGNPCTIPLSVGYSRGCGRSRHQHRSLDQICQQTGLPCITCHCYRRKGNHSGMHRQPTSRISDGTSSLDVVRKCRSRPSRYIVAHNDFNQYELLELSSYYTEVPRSLPVFETHVVHTMAHDTKTPRKGWLIIISYAAASNCAGIANRLLSATGGLLPCLSSPSLCIL